MTPMPMTFHEVTPRIQPKGEGRFQYLKFHQSKKPFVIKDMEDRYKGYKQMKRIEMDSELSLSKRNLFKQYFSKKKR